MAGRQNLPKISYNVFQSVYNIEFPILSWCMNSVSIDFFFIPLGWIFLSAQELPRENDSVFLFSMFKDMMQ